MNLKAGTLNHRVTIQLLEVDQDSDGNVIEDWPTFAVVWANVWPASLREFIAAGIEQSKVTVAVKIRYLAGVKPSMRILLHDGRIYQVEGVLADPESGREWLTLPCSEVLSG